MSWALTGALSFESIYRPLSALVTGGAIGAYHGPSRLTGMSLAKALRDDAVDGVSMTPSQLRALVSETWRLSRIRTVVVVGEKLPVDLARRAQAAFGPNVEIQNWYGPTESVMSTTMHRFDAARDAGASVPIGVAAPGSAVHVLDDGLNPVPRGVLGSLHVGGVRLSDGYLKRPELNAKAFAPDPFNEGGRLYATGDLGWRTGDGTLVYQGRRDDQVKVNGVRTEFAEVERAVESCSGVERCAVALTDDPTPRLVAFYVARRDIHRNELISAASRTLPRATVPVAFLRIEAVPLSPNGKTDRRKLTALAAEATPGESVDDGSRTDPPQGELERGLAEIWRGLLRREHVGRWDDFFDLGGDSLAFVQMILKAESRFGVRLPPDALGQSASLAQVAEAVAARRSSVEAPATADGGAAEGGRASQPKPPLASRAARRLRALFAAPKDKPLLAEAPVSEVVRQLRHMTRTWPGEQVGRDAPLFALNPAGRRPPLFWCFNGAEEPAAMAAGLGADQPVYAMRSMQGIVEIAEKGAFLDEIARLYADEITRVSPGGPYLLGGNCQSGRIAEWVARALMLRGLPVQRLIVLEYAPTTPYPGGVSMIFGDRSRRFNPYFLYPEPERAWRRLFADFTCDVIPGDHGEYFRRDRVGALCASVAMRIEEALREPPMVLPAQSRLARLTCDDGAMVARVGQTIVIEVTVQNAGKGDWPPASSSGIALVGRWRGATPEESSGCVARSDLEARVAAGGVWRTTLAVAAPDTPGRHRLDVELVEQGIGRIPSDGDACIEVSVVA